MNVLTNRELKALENRIEEIGETIELCDADRDADVLENLETELNQIIKTIKKSMEVAS